MCKSLRLYVASEIMKIGYLPGLDLGSQVPRWIEAVHLSRNTSFKPQRSTAQHEIVNKVPGSWIHDIRQLAISSHSLESNHINLYSFDGIGDNRCRCISTEYVLCIDWHSGCFGVPMIL